MRFTTILLAATVAIAAAEPYQNASGRLHKRGLIRWSAKKIKGGAQAVGGAAKKVGSAIANTSLSDVAGGVANGAKAVGGAVVSGAKAVGNVIY
jgi:hypothetical protein